MSTYCTPPASAPNRPSNWGECPRSEGLKHPQYLLLEQLIESRLHAFMTREANPPCGQLEPVVREALAWVRERIHVGANESSDFWLCDVWQHKGLAEAFTHLLDRLRTAVAVAAYPTGDIKNAYVAAADNLANVVGDYVAHPSNRKEYLQAYQAVWRARINVMTLKLPSRDLTVPKTLFPAAPPAAGDLASMPRDAPPSHKDDGVSRKAWGKRPAPEATDPLTIQRPRNDKRKATTQTPPPPGAPLVPASQDTDEDNSELVRIFSTGIAAAGLPPPTIQVDGRVVVEGLGVGPELNGCYGTVKHYFSDNGRWVVEMDDANEDGKKVLLAFLPKSLRTVASNAVATPPAAAAAEEEEDLPCGTEEQGAAKVDSPTSSPLLQNSLTDAGHDESNHSNFGALQEAVQSSGESRPCTQPPSPSKTQGPPLRSPPSGATTDSPDLSNRWDLTQRPLPPLQGETNDKANSGSGSADSQPLPL